MWSPAEIEFARRAMGGGPKGGGSVAEKEKGKSRDAGREAGVRIVLGLKWECGAYVACTFEDSAYVSSSLFFSLLFREFDNFSVRVLQWVRPFHAPLSETDLILSLREVSAKLRIVGKYIKGQISILNCWQGVQGGFGRGRGCR